MDTNTELLERLGRLDQAVTRANLRAVWLGEWLVLLVALVFLVFVFLIESRIGWSRWTEVGAVPVVVATALWARSSRKKLHMREYGGEQS